jgi:hypothetical protein
MTSGASTMPENSVRPKKRGTRARVSPAITPSTVATVEADTATPAEIRAASIRPWFCHNEAYHLVEKPPQTVTSLDSLKL